MRLYPDTKDKDLIRVEVRDQEMWKKLKDCKEEIGKSCRFGGYLVYDAIEQGYFERSGRFQSCETISPSKKIVEEVIEAVKGLKCGDIMSFSLSNISPPKALIQESIALASGV